MHLGDPAFAVPRSIAREDVRRDNQDERLVISWMCAASRICAFTISATLVEHHPVLKGAKVS